MPRGFTLWQTEAGPLSWTVRAGAVLWRNWVPGDEYPNGNYSYCLKCFRFSWEAFSFFHLNAKHSPTGSRGWITSADGLACLTLHMRAALCPCTWTTMLMLFLLVCGLLIGLKDFHEFTTCFASDTPWGISLNRSAAPVTQGQNELFLLPKTAY